VTDGQIDVRRQADELAAKLPGPLAPLARVAYNYAWSWQPGGHDLFERIDPERWELTHRNPVRQLQEASPASLRAAAEDRPFIAAAEALEQRIDRIVAAPYADYGIDPAYPVAFLCAEFGVHVSLPVYSGGLGALAGDILKEASDLRVPMVAVGLMYGRGYFRQRIDASGWQHEYWVNTDPERVPAALVRDSSGEPLQLTVPVADRDVAVRIWRVDVGRVPLFLLDTDFAANDTVHRWITARLYEGDTDVRLAQYTLLGVGSIRALQALGIDPGVLHLNEGHAMLAPIELGLSAGAREKTVFTTHTPVPAGNDSYPAEQVRRALQRYIAGGPIAEQELIALGRTNPEDEGEPFGITQVAMRVSRSAGGVSRRHGEVAREMWTGLWPGRDPDQVPIAHVTNGVHIPTWLGGPMRKLLDRHLGPGWIEQAADPATWEPIADIPDAELWATRTEQRRELLELVALRATRDRLERTDTRQYVNAVASALDPEVLTIGFARRVATYKRLDLLMRSPDQAAALLTGERPMQLLLAGKAHPRDEEAKRLVQRLFDLKAMPQMAERVVFLDDYDLATGAALTRGCDVWLNLPRPPLEASGTSGMKSAINGGLQLSVLDGWWAEGYQPGLGWAISGDVDGDHHAQDERDAATLNHLLNAEVIPTFYERDANGLPAQWIQMVRASLQALGPEFSATRMVRDYLEGPYRS
jgi:glycogen phosphorylase